MCPFKKSKCGNDQNITFDNSNENKTFTVKNLSAGESCTFMIKSKCGSPAFKVENKTYMNDSNCNITFIEYEKDN